MQGDLLRVLQEGEVRRVGGSAVIKVNARVISGPAATSPPRLPRTNAQRSGLSPQRGLVADPAAARTRRRYHRPDPAPRRPHAALLGRAEPHISDEAMYRIRNYSWPGNVRELENALARAVAMSQRGVILPGDLPALTREADLTTCLRFTTTGPRLRSCNVATSSESLITLVITRPRQRASLASIVAPFSASLHGKRKRTTSAIVLPAKNRRGDAHGHSGSTRAQSASREA